MASNASRIALKRFGFPQVAIARFVALRTMRTAAFWGIVFCMFVASKSIGYAKAYPTVHERASLAASLTNNIGLNAIFGAPHNVTSVAGLTTWNTLSAMVIIGAIWALLTATKCFRGEEEAGRWELLVAGQTTALKAAANALAGLCAGLVALYITASVGFTLVGRVPGVDFSVSSALFFGLAAVAGAAEFMFIGALASQIMPTRGRAASLTVAVFGICFLLRAMADISSVHWLLDISPLGWIEKLGPLYGSDPVWLIPIAIFISCVGLLTIWLAGRRDLGDGLLADRDTAKPRMALLGAPLTIAVRLTRATTLSWLVAVAFVSGFFGILTKSAAQAFSSSTGATRILSRLAHASQAAMTTLAAKTFLGVIFFLLMLLIMAYVASALGAVREDESQGYLDNLLVGPISRIRWLSGRILLIFGVVLVAGAVSSIMVWAGEVSQQGGVAFRDVLPAGINAIAPALFTLGLGVLAYGFVPRLVSGITYGVLAWSFLVQMVSSGVNLNHWILDTSVLYHMSLAPATDPNWRSFTTLIALGFVACLVGMWRFRTRDLQSA